MALFPPTKSMSTYLYCVLAGPFEQIKLKETYNVHNSIYRIYRCLYIALLLIYHMYKKWLHIFLKQQLNV
jgi:hypothetical protein